MVKTPKTRHSKSHREPMTIDLSPGDVTRVAGQTDVDAEGAGPAEATPETSGNPQATDHETVIPAAAHEHEAPRDAGVETQELPRRPANGAASPRQEDDEVTPPSQPKSSGLHPFVAGVAGAIIALAGAGALQYAGVLGVPGASLDAVNGELTTMKTQLAELSNTENGGDALGRLKVVSDTLDQTRSELAQLKASVESAVGEVQGVGQVRDKLAALETSVADLGKAAGGAEADLAPINEKLTALDTLANGAVSAANEQQARLGAVETSLSQLSAKVDAQASQPKIALSIAASALKSALDRGAPFTAELETFAAIAPDAPQLPTLRPYAEKGVPTRADIASGIDEAANAMVDAATPLDENAGFFQSLMASAEKLVKVRPVGAVSGTGIPEIVARLEVAVSQGEYAKAIAEYDSLPDTAKAAGADFAGKLKARLEAETQVDALVADAMKA